MSSGMVQAPNLVERQQWYVKRFPNTGLVAGQRNLNVELQTDSDAPFRMTGVALYIFNSSSVPLGASGNVGVRMRWTRPDGSWIQKTLVSTQMLNPYDTGAATGAGGQGPPFFSYFSALGTNIFYPAGTSITIDLEQLTGVTDALVLVVYNGTKIFPAGTVWNPGYQQKSRKRPYIGYNFQVRGAQLPAVNLPLNIAPDAGFVWQHGQQTDGCGPGAEGAFSFDFGAGARGQDYFDPTVTGMPAPPAAPQISAAATMGSEIQGNRQLSNATVFVESATVRYQILMDEPAAKLRAYKSTNGGLTWAEMNAAGAPAINVSNPAAFSFAMYGAARDVSPAVKNIYCVFWDSDNTVSEITFSMASDTWQAKVKSTLAVLDAVNLQEGTFFGMTATHRPSDNSLVIAVTNNTTSVAGIFYNRVSYAKILLGSSTWDGAWTPIGTTGAGQQEWFVTGAVLDPATNNVHFQFTVQHNDPFGRLDSIQHQALHPDGTLGTIDQVFASDGDTGPFITIAWTTRPVANPQASGATELVFGYRVTNLTGSDFIYLSRAPAADNPTWVQSVALAIPVAGDIVEFQLASVGVNSLASFYVTSPDFATAQFFTSTNFGALLPWSAGVLLGTSTFAQSPNNSFSGIAGVPCQVGTMKALGVKIRDWAGKYYMNDFVPAELIFGYDNAQTPGLPYPEIYIPKNQALYLDLQAFGPVNGLATLCFKGMKVYGEQ